MAVAVEHGKKSSDASVEPTADDGNPCRSNKRRHQFDVSNQIDHREEHSERDRCADYKADSQRPAKFGRLSVFVGFLDGLFTGRVSHGSDVRRF